MSSVPVGSMKGGICTFEGFLSRADKSESDYLLLPFEVPEGVVRLDVSYEYSDETGAALWSSPGNVVDLGVFDSRGTEFISGDGFRGTSGSARHEVFLGIDQATPGYLPGPIYPGTWHVMLGLYRIASQGCNYRVTVRATRGDSSPAAQADPYDPGVLCAEARWYPGDLHCHSHHSEASGSLGDLVEGALERGLEFLAITEHNTVSHLRGYSKYASSGLLLIPGEEITTYYGHANVWGITGWHEFRASSTEQIQRIVDDARDRGALISINHPKAEGPAWKFGTVTGYDCIEAWQAYWFVGNHESLAFWDERLRQGKRVTAVGGSDCHQTAPGEEASSVILGAPTTWVYAKELSPRGILEGIREGHVFVNSDPVTGPRVELTATCGDEQVMAGDELRVARHGEARFSVTVTGGEGLLVRLIDREGEAAVMEINADPFASEHTLTVDESTYVRAEVIAPPEADLAAQPEALWVEALSNPVYLRLHE